MCIRFFEIWRLVEKGEFGRDVKEGFIVWSD